MLNPTHKGMLIAGILAVVVTAGIVFLMDFNPVSLVTPEPATKTTVEELLRAYNENEIRADRMYKGELLAVTGTVESVNHVLGGPYIVLVDPDGKQAGGLHCNFPRGQAERLLHIHKGEKVELVCTGAGKMFHVILDACKLGS